MSSYPRVSGNITLLDHFCLIFGTIRVQALDPIVVDKHSVIVEFIKAILLYASLLLITPHCECVTKDAHKEK